MKPRTKLQHDVFDRSGELPCRAKQIKDYAVEKCLDHVGYMTKSRVICMDCGERFSPCLVHRKRTVCPHCNSKLKIQEIMKRSLDQQGCISIAEIVGPYQLIRNFEVRSSHKDGHAAMYSCREVSQDWIGEDGKRTIVARQRFVNFHSVSWIGDLEIRSIPSRGSWRYAGANKYDVLQDAWHPGSKFKERYSMYGINTRMRGISFVEAIEILPNEPRAETLLKAKQFGLLRHFANGQRWIVAQYWNSVKIVIRNKYKIENVRDWGDYLRLLDFFGKDLRNAYYVCPKNLKKEHDRYVAKKRRHDEKMRLEEKRRKAAENEAEYRKFIGRFEGVSIKSGNLTVEPLKTVGEFMAEGDEMRHCVFESEYFKRINSLVLSAKVGGKRVETVEFSLDKAQVVQSRGRFNENSEHHDRIVRLVNRNATKIMKLKMV